MPNVAVVPPQHVPVKRLQELIAWAKTNIQQRFLQVGARALWSTPEDAAA
ncbi:MAG: hypothetical protein QJR07_16395 [Acetobacteraceae bacterium]|nr:hypothetical protein [Acetobacteraceae bacterium]MDI3308671.1 hypothetical protein [Acetobacteraceae bacterium]